VGKQTDSTSASKAGAIRSRRRRIRNRILGTAGVLTAIALAVFLLLPIWASTERGRAFVLEQINKTLHGNINVDKWRLSWFRGIKIERLTIKNSRGDIVFQCREIHTDMTLWGYMWGSYTLGNTRLLEPALQLNKYADGSNDLQHIFAGSDLRIDAKLHAMLNGLSGLIKIERGTVTLSAVGVETPLHFENISAEIPVASPQAHIHFLLRADSATVPDTVVAEGNLPPLVDWPGNPAALVGDLEVHASHIPVGSLARWMGLDPAWSQAFGISINTLTYNSDTLGTLSTAELSMYAAEGSILARLQMESRPDAFILSVPDTMHYLRVNARLSAPVSKLLRFVNPLFEQATMDSGAISLAVSDADIDFHQPAAATVSGQLFCQKIILRSGGLLGGIVALAGQSDPPSAGNAPVPVSVSSLRIAVADQRINCDNATFTLPPSRQIKFSGYTDFSGALHQRVTVKLDDFVEPSNTLGSGTVEAPVTGSVDRPVLEIPQN
jgi:hypothetical protein